MRISSEKKSLENGDLIINNKNIHIDFCEKEEVASDFICLFMELCSSLYTIMQLIIKYVFKEFLLTKLVRKKRIFFLILDSQLPISPLIA